MVTSLFCYPASNGAADLSVFLTRPLPLLGITVKVSWEMVEERHEPILVVQETEMLQQKSFQSDRQRY